LITLGPRSGKGQQRICSVEPGNKVTCVDPVAFGNGELENAAADLRRDLHLGRLHLTGHADPVGRGGRAARVVEHHHRAQA
jgi:hypothetical protein